MKRVRIHNLVHISSPEFPVSRMYKMGRLVTNTEPRGERVSRRESQSEGVSNRQLRWEVRYCQPGESSNKLVLLSGWRGFLQRLLT